MTNETNATCPACGEKQVFPVESFDGEWYSCGSRFPNDGVPFQSDRCKANVFAAELERVVKTNAELRQQLTTLTADLDAALVREDALRDVATRILADCDDTYYDPEDMSAEWKRITADLRAALALSAEGGETK